MKLCHFSLLFYFSFFCFIISINIIIADSDHEYGQINDNDPSLVRIPNGLIQGTIFSNKIIMFRSIPYAEAPIDELRWSDPLSKESWGYNTTLYATYNPPGCIQSCSLPPHGCPLITSEDCLFLNIYKPLNHSTELLPVMVFFHGGNFYQGYSGGPLYNGTKLVEESNVIIITVNYRLGALGFLWSFTGPNGNYGMKDQLLSLQWIHDNIIYFNGDNNKVVIYGQSAGAISVAMHMAYSYHNDLNLFQAAIMESEPFGLPIRDTETWGLLPNNFYNQLGCNYDRLSHNEAEFWSCLRNKSADNILSAQLYVQNNPLNEIDHFWDLFLPWSPTAGTDMYSEQIFWSFQSGNIIDIPYIIGTVKNEGRLFVYEIFNDSLSQIELISLMELLVGKHDTSSILKQYPLPTNTTDYRDYASMILTDGLFNCASWNITMQHSILPFIKNSAYFYHFNHVSSFNQQLWGTNFTYCYDYVCHGSELEYVFHPNAAPDNTTYNNDENNLAYLMQIFWTNLAKNNDPATSFGIKWKKFEINNQYEMIFNAPGTQLVSNIDNKTCQFWNTLNFNWIK